MAGERTLSSRCVFEGVRLRVRIDTVRTPAGGEATREIVDSGDAVVMVPVDNEGRLLLVRQYRQAAGRELLELPAGMIDPGEDAEATVVREMQEETGYRPGRVVRLGGFYSAPGFCTEYLHLYLATDLVPSRLQAEDTAGISLLRLTPDEVRRRVVAGEIEDAKTLAGLHLYLEHGRPAGG